MSDPEKVILLRSALKRYVDADYIHDTATDDELRAQIHGERLIEIDEANMTEKQRHEHRVSLHDTRSILGRELHKARSKYQPHVGAKEMAKLAERQ